MRIVIDLQGAQTSGSRFRGIGRYTLSFVKEFIHQKNESEIILLLNSNFPDSIESIKSEFKDILPINSIRIWTAPQPVKAQDFDNASRRKTSEVVREFFIASLNPDWVIVTSLFEGLVDEAVTSVGRLFNFKTAIILYDLIPWIHADIYLADQMALAWYFEKLDHLRRADLLFAISESTANEAINYLGFTQSSAVNISTAADDIFKPHKLNSNDLLKISKIYKLNHPFVMYTGGIDHRKNIERLIEAWSKLPRYIRNGHHLAIVCNADDNAKFRLLNLANSFGIADDELVLTGFVPENDLMLLYNSCKLFVFPSWHEGFGLPALEAMQCGKPVIGSNCTSLPEVIGRSDALFNPFLINDITEKLQFALSDGAFLSSLSKHSITQAEKFSWKSTANRAWDSLKTHTLHYSDNLSLKKSSRIKLAYFSPLPPSRSGIADYSVELLSDLTRWYDIDLILVDPKSINHQGISNTCTVRSIEYFIENNLKYQRVLYHFGNSEFHEHMFNLLRRYPGCVVLHDFFLSGVNYYSEIKQLRPNAFFNSLYHSHGYAALVYRAQQVDIRDVIMKYPSNLSVLQESLGVIVHSDFNKILANNFYGKNVSADWSIIPLLRTPSVKNTRNSRLQLHLSDDYLVIAAFGILGETKMNHRLLECFIKSKLAKQTNVILIFVGMADDSYGLKIHKMIDQSGFNDRIKITGWVDTATYNDWLQAADIAVQLRTDSRGETSAAALDCLNNGLATIVNANGSLAEFTDSSVLMLPDLFTDSDLIRALEEIAADKDLRLKLSCSAKEIVRKLHNPRRCAELYFKAIEKYYSQSISSPLNFNKWVLLQDLNIDEKDIISTSDCLSKNHAIKFSLLNLFIDVSDIILGNNFDDSNFLFELLVNPPIGLRIEPIYTTSDGDVLYARHFTCKFLGISSDFFSDQPIDKYVDDKCVKVEPGWKVNVEKILLNFNYSSLNNP